MRFRNIVCVAGALGLACEQNPAAPAPAGVTHTYYIVAEFSSTLYSAFRADKHATAIIS